MLNSGGAWEGKFVIRPGGKKHGADVWVYSHYDPSSSKKSRYAKAKYKINADVRTSAP